MIPRSRRSVTSAVLVYLLLIVSLQIFLVTVAVDALQSGNDGLAWTTAVVSVVLAAGGALFYRYLRSS
ncbi:MAG TPA: DUF6755 family protein [Acidimicrobiia bacterium]|nr:DUF6755 family protein [Acidimicrobiia bacterium]